MRLFVTGGNGFIGATVVRRLVEAGDEVVCLVRSTSKTARIDALGATVARVVGDVRDATSFRSAMSRCDATIHLAAPGGWGGDSPALLRDVIEGGMRQVLDVAQELGDHRVVVVSSTAAVAASNAPVLFDETAVYNIRDLLLHYAHAKHAAERLAHEAFARGTRVVIVNPSEVYGPGDDALGTARNLVDFATSVPVLVCDGGTGIVHVDDVASGIVAALERGRPGERYILSGENVTIRALAELVVELRRRRVPIVNVPNPLARWTARAASALRLPVPFEPAVVPYATRYWFVDNAKAQRELGVTFRPARDVVQSTLEWLERAGPKRIVTKS